MVYRCPSGLRIDNHDENFEVNAVETIACKTNTVRTVGLALIGVGVVLAVLAPEIFVLGGAPALGKLITAFGY